MRFDEARVGGDGFEILENRIKPLDVADLQDAILLLRELDEFRRLPGVVGHRFLDEDVFALLKQRFGEFEVRGCRRGDVESIAGGGNFCQGVKDANVVSGGDFLGGFGGHVVNAGEINLAGCGQAGINPRVFLAERAHAQNSDPNLNV